MALLAARFESWRAGRESALRATPSSASSCASMRTPSAYMGYEHAASMGNANRSDMSASSMVPPDEMDEFMASLGRRRGPEGFLASDSVSSAFNAVATAAGGNVLSCVGFVDSMASAFIVPSVDYLIKVTDASPTSEVKTANGSIVPEATGTAGIHLLDDSGTWHYFEVTDVYVLPSCPNVLYSTGYMAKHFGTRTLLEDGYVQLPQGSRVPFSSESFAIEMSFGPPPTRAMASRSLPGAPSALRNDRGSDSTRPVTQVVLWQRLGFPSEHAWRYVSESTVDHGLPHLSHLKTDFPVTESVARARGRALPFHKIRDPDDIPAPGASLFLDFAGPMVPSFPHKFTYYCGIVDAGSQYARVYPCHGPTAAAARESLENYLADLRSLLGLSHRLRPHVITSDQGSAFMSTYFREFLADDQLRHRPSAVYTPQQNAPVERMWGVRFSTARALLAHATLGPAFHPHALQTANWIWNRLPLASRGNLSAFQILARRPASLAYLRSFGCMVRVFIPDQRRVGDRHFADRGALGINLGPSEVSPATVVYLPSLRRLLVTRQVVFYEDVFPGVKGVEGWRDHEGEEGVHEGVPLPPNTQTPVMTHPDEHAPPQPSLPASSFGNTAPASPPVRQSPAQPIAQSPGHAIQFDDVPVDELQGVGSGPTGFQRGLGPIPVKRGNRKPPERFAFLTNPVVATRARAERNFAIMSYHDLSTPSFAFLSCISGMGNAYVVTSTADMGDIVIPKGYRQARESKNASYWLEAIAKEYNGLVSLRTWDAVAVDDIPAGANLMNCHLVFTVKRLSDGTIDKFKARLVADGNTQRYGVDFDRVFSTVVKVSTIRTVLAIAALRDYNLTSIDVRQAFLQADLSEDLYMRMPPGMPSYDARGRKLAVKLRRSLYGLKQAGREWGLLLSGFLKQWGFEQSSIDVCMYTYEASGSILWLLVWVDDTVIVDNDPSLRERFVSDLGKRFPIEDKYELTWILGVNVTRDRQKRTLILSQELYVQDLIKRHISLLEGLTRTFDSPADPSIALSSDMSPVPDSDDYVAMASRRETYMILVGAFLWLANVSYPQLSYITSKLARFVANPGPAHFTAALRVLIYLKCHSSHCLTFAPKPDRPMRVYVDSDWGVKFSISGGLYAVYGCPVAWFSKTQRSVSLSSTEAEYFAAMVACRDGLYIRDILIDLGVKLDKPIPVRSDNAGVSDLSLDAVAFKKTKHILRAAYFLRDLCTRQFFVVVWIVGASNPADIFTKAQELSVFRTCTKLLSSLDSIPDKHK